MVRQWASEHRHETYNEQWKWLIQRVSMVDKLTICVMWFSFLIQINGKPEQMQKPLGCWVSSVITWLCTSYLNKGFALHLVNKYRWLSFIFTLSLSLQAFHSFWFERYWIYRDVSYLEQKHSSIHLCIVIPGNFREMAMKYLSKCSKQRYFILEFIKGHWRDMYLFLFVYKSKHALNFYE